MSVVARTGCPVSETNPGIEVFVFGGYKELLYHRFHKTSVVIDEIQYMSEVPLGLSKCEKCEGSPV